MECGNAARSRSVCCFEGVYGSKNRGASEVTSQPTSTEWSRVAEGKVSANFSLPKSEGITFLISRKMVICLISKTLVLIRFLEMAVMQVSLC